MDIPKIFSVPSHKLNFKDMKLLIEDEHRPSRNRVVPTIFNDTLSSMMKGPHFKKSEMTNPLKS